MNPHARPLNVLLSAYACEPDRGSEPGVGWNWMLALLRRGHRVWVITRENNRERIEKACAERGLPLGTRLHFIYYDLPRWARWWKRGGTGVHLYYALWQRCICPLAMREHRRHRFDLVHHITFGVWRETSYLHKLGVPFIFGPVGGGEEAPWTLVRTMPVYDQLLEIVRAGINRLALLNLPLRACIRSATLVVARTPETARWLRRLGADCIVAPDIGVECARILQAPATPNSPLRCIYAGRLLGWKGVHLAIDAIGKARQSGAAVVLTVVGRGRLRDALESRAAALGVSDAVCFVDWLDQRALFEAYRSHDLLLFPSMHDSGGTVVLEAMAHGLPVVCLKLGGPSVVVDSSCGAAIEARGRTTAEIADDLESVLVSLASDGVLLERAKLGALERAAAMSWDSTAQRTYGQLPSGFAAGSVRDSDSAASPHQDASMAARQGGHRFDSAR